MDRASARNSNLVLRVLMLALTAWVVGGLAPARAETGTPYTTEIRGMNASGLEGLLSQASQLVSMQGNPPATTTGLRRRAAGDIPRLEAVLRAEGYYNGTVTYALDTSQSPVAVTLEVDQGRRFLLRSFNIVYEGEPTPHAPRTIEDLGDETRGTPATGRLVLSLEAQVIDYLHNHGFPFAEAANRDARAHVQRARLDVTLDVTLGPYTRFGPTTVSGLDRTDEEYVRDRITWREGEPFSRQKLRDVHLNLEATGLFASVTVDTADDPDVHNALGVDISATERAPRTVGVGLRYGTSEGAGARAYWEHRNLLGEGEHLRAELEFAQINQQLSLVLRQPRFLRPNQTLISGVSAFNTVAESYDETGGTASIGLERRLSSHLTVEAGLGLRVSTVDEGDIRRDTRTIDVPLGLRYDDSDDVLDPTEGVRFSLILTPTFGESETSLLYWQTESRASIYQRVHDRVVLAARARVGATMGEDHADVPASDRFYSGGGGSVRGIGYQLAGPIDADRDPVGGRSVFEIGAEARLRVTDRFGIVPFVEGGSVFTSDIPDFGEDLYWGVGVGLRYYTRFGPIRLDIATPLDRRAEIDGVVQFYISLGQAF